MSLSSAIRRYCYLSKSGNKLRTALTDNIDIYRTAKLLIDQHGQDADLFACQRADELLDAGDIEGQRVWLRIVKALREMLNTTPDKLIH